MIHAIRSLAQGGHRFLSLNWRSKALIVDLVKRDFKVRYLGSLLGSYWNFVHPVAMISIYTLIFSHVMKARMGDEPGPFAYTLYLCAGMLPWGNFTESLSRGTNVFFEYAHLIKKIAFPKDILQTVVVLSHCMTFGISMVIYSFLLLVAGHGLSLCVSLFPVIFVLQMLFTIGLANILAVLNVFFRDVQQILNIVLQIWFWLTPIVYLVDRLPQALRFFVNLNPFYYFAHAYQQIFYFQTWPSLGLMVGMSLGAMVTMLLGAWMLTHFKDELADEL